MEGKPCCLALQLQEFEFQIRYHKGSHNTNADALSHCFSVAPTGVVHGPTRDELLQAQLADPILSHLVTSFQRDHLTTRRAVEKNLSTGGGFSCGHSLSSKMVYCTGTIQNLSARRRP